MCPPRSGLAVSRSAPAPLSPGPAACERCGEPCPAGHERYCSKRCGNQARNKRWRANRAAAGRPVPRRKPERWGPYDKFVAATLPGKRVQVPETPEQQANAELLIKRGCCAYRNRAGFIRDIGVPRKSEHRGKVWAVEPKREVAA